MNKNFKFSERIKLEHHLNIRQDCSAIKLATILNKSRSTIYYELIHCGYRVYEIDTNQGLLWYRTGVNKWVAENPQNTFTLLKSKF